MQIPTLLLYPSKPSQSDEERLAAYHKQHAPLPSLVWASLDSNTRALVLNEAMRQMSLTMCMVPGLAEALLAPVLETVAALHGPAKKPSKKPSRKPSSKRKK